MGKSQLAAPPKLVVAIVCQLQRALGVMTEILRLIHSAAFDPASLKILANAFGDLGIDCARIRSLRRS
jgi:hypothetical protein